MTALSMSTCQDYLRMLASINVAVGDFYLLLGHAFEAQALPSYVRRGETQACYRNAAELAFSSPDLAYCEGYAMPAGLIPVHHAWCVTRQGLVVDPTWARCAEAEYFGIALSTTWLMGCLAEGGVWGLLAERVPVEWLSVEPTAYLSTEWLPDEARLHQFDVKRRSWLRLGAGCK